MLNFFVLWQRKSRQEKLVVISGILVYILLSLKFSTQMGDFGDFVKAGQLITNKQNPYNSLMYVNSPVSGVIVFFIYKAFPFIFFPIFWHTLNLLGIFFFFRTISGNKHSLSLVTAIALMAFFNTTRAMFGNVQVSGLVLGLFGLAFYLETKKLPVFTIAFLIFLAVELKPQLALSFLIIFLFNKKFRFLHMFFLLMYLMVAHVQLEFLYLPKVNEYWLKKVLIYSGNSLREGYEISIWKLIALLTRNELFPRMFSFIFSIFVLIMIAIYSKKNQKSLALLLACCFPLCNSYLHLYDLVPLATILTLTLIRYQNLSLIFVLYILLQFFPLDSKILAILNLTFLFLVLYFYHLQRISFKEIIYLIGGVLVISVGGLVFLQNKSEEVQIITLFVLPIIYVTILNWFNIKKHLDSLMVFH